MQRGPGRNHLWSRESPRLAKLIEVFLDFELTAEQHESRSQCGNLAEKGNSSARHGMGMSAQHFSSEIFPNLRTSDTWV